MPHVNRLIATIVTLAIMTIVLTFAYGYYTATLESLFSFSMQSLAVKLVLSIGLLVIVFFGRPHSQFRQVFFGIVASTALLFAAFGAFTESLLLGDALILIIGTIITATEATEGEVAPKTARTAGSLASTSSKVQQL